MQSDPPFMLMIAGPNGAGKSTLTDGLRAESDLGTYINPDEIAAQLTGSEEERVRSAQAEADRMRDDCLQSQTSFTFETVMSHPSKIAFVKAANDARFETQLFFVGVSDKRILQHRVANRVRKGGHPVPLEKIFSRFDKTMANLSEACLACSYSKIWDNSEVGGMRLVCEVDNNYPGKITRHEPVPAWVEEYVISPIKAKWAQSPVPEFIADQPVVAETEEDRPAP